MVLIETQPHRLTEDFARAQEDINMWADHAQKRSRPDVVITPISRESVTVLTSKTFPVAAMERLLP